MILQVLTSTLGILPGAVRQELVAGTFESLVLSPLGAVRGIVAMLIFPFMMSMVMAVIMLSFAAAVFGLSVKWSTVPLAPPVALLGMLAFSAFSLLVTSAILAFKQGPLGQGYIITGIAFVAGFYFPVTLLPDWIQWTSEVQPFTPAVDLMRHLLVDTPLTEPAWVALVKLAGFAAVLLPVGVAVLRVALRRSSGPARSLSTDASFGVMPTVGAS
jgi:ABC-type multidrug transport system permease subunit